MEIQKYHGPTDGRTWGGARDNCVSKNTQAKVFWKNWTMTTRWNAQSGQPGRFWHCRKLSKTMKLYDYRSEAEQGILLNFGVVVECKELSILNTIHYLSVPRVCLECTQSVFRVCPECFRGCRVCRECIVWIALSDLWVIYESAHSVLRVCTSAQCTQSVPSVYR